MSTQPRDQTRDIFDVIATYFVNTYWFPLFKHAFDSFSERQFPNIEDAYKVMIDRYRVAFCVKQNSQGRENANYSKIITDLQNNYNTWMDSKLTCGDFIDIVCKQIIPEDMYKTLGRQDTRKDELFRKTITQAVTNFTVFVSTQGLNGVVKQRDATNSKTNQMMLKEEFIKILYHERNELYGRFMATKSGVDPSKRQNNISSEAFDRMAQKIKELIHEKAKIQNELNLVLFAAKKESAAQKARIAELTTQLANTGGRRAPPPPKVQEIGSDEEEVTSEDDSSEVQSSKGLEKINDPTKDDFITKKIATSGAPLTKNDPITQPLDEVPDYSGEDVSIKAPPRKNSNSSDESTSMSMDE